MPAYAKPLVVVKCNNESHSAKKGATHEVFNGRNELIGSFCSPCAHALVKRINEGQAR